MSGRKQTKQKSVSRLDYVVDPQAAFPFQPRRLVTVFGLRGPPKPKDSIVSIAQPALDCEAVLQGILSQGLQLVLEGGREEH